MDCSHCVFGQRSSRVDQFRDVSIAKLGPGRGIWSDAIFKECSITRVVFSKGIEGIESVDWRLFFHFTFGFLNLIARKRRFFFFFWRGTGGSLPLICYCPNINNKSINRSFTKRSAIKFDRFSFVSFSGKNIINYKFTQTSIEGGGNQKTIYTHFM